VCGAVVVGVLAVVGFLALVTPPHGEGGSRVVGGHLLLVVLSGSMSPAIQTGDLLVDRAVSAPEAATLRVGQVVTVHRGDSVVTHRIAEVVLSPGGVSYVTKGDANASPDGEPVGPGEVVGTVSFRVPLLGSALVSLRDPLVAACAVAALLLLGAAWVLWRAART
jgi:signal peptidase